MAYATVPKEKEHADDELKQNLAVLGQALSENLKETAKDVVTDTINVTKTKIKDAVAQMNPRDFIVEHPGVSLTGALLAGMWVGFSRTNPLRSKTAMAVLGLGFDLARTYALHRQAHEQQH